MIVIGCDFGLRKSGIVLLDQDFEIISQNLVKVHPSVNGAKRLVQIEAGFDSIISPYYGLNEIQIFIEGYAYGARYQRESLAELGGVMRRYFYMQKLDYWVIPPTSLKYFVTGSGRATKNYVKKCTKDKWGIPFKSDDVCDAYGLARLGVTTINVIKGNDDILEAQEQDIVSDVIKNNKHYLNGNTAKRKS